MTRRLVALTVALAVSTGAARAADALARVRAAGVLRVGDAAPPRYGASPAGPTRGFKADLMAELARALGVTVRWVALPPADVLPALAAGRVDLAMPLAMPPAMPPAAARRLSPLPPVADGSTALLKRRGDGTLLVPGDAVNKAVGVLCGSPAGAQLRAFAAAQRGRVSLRPYPGLAAAEDDLAAGRVAAVAGPLVELAAAAADRPELFETVTPPLGPRADYAALAVRDADHAGLADAASAAILAMAADGRLAALQRRWFGVAFPAPAGAPQPGPGQAPPPSTTSKP